MSAKMPKSHPLPLTTGSVAAAAAKAAALLWLTKKPVAAVKIGGPQSKNWQTYLPVERQFLTKKAALCWVKKPVNQDYDVTQQLLIGAKVTPRKDSLVVLKAGFGVGMVTKPGLPVAVGKPAINPVPQRQIIKELQELNTGHGYTVTFFIPGGVEKAQKTFNPRLGIVKGLSIIGTTGLVKPMSASAYKKSLLLKLKQAAELGFKTVILVPGEIGATAAQRLLKVNADQTVLTSNYVGYLYKQAVKLSLNTVFLGHIGKVVKVAAGYYYTHSQKTPDRLELLRKIVSRWDRQLAAKLNTAVTAEQAAKVINKKNPVILGHVAKLATQKLILLGSSPIGTVIIDWSGNFLAADKSLEEIKGFLC